MNFTFLRLAWLSPLLVLAACGGTATSTESSGSAMFASVAPAAGRVSLASPDRERLISGFVFTNDGTSDVNVSQVVVTLAKGTAIDGEGGFGVQRGDSVTFLFDASQTQEVASLSFLVDGSTEKLVVTETSATGPVPGTAPTPTIAQ